ncbi:hypothetical protein ZWY2020_047520 [Hordeum vulgare]|nr:hypothetical protein ZWY2020_047520 [Hordeum vulgare]
MQLTATDAAVVIVKLVNDWVVRSLVLLSLATHLVLVLLAGVRRRRATGFGTALLWFSYQVAGWAATRSMSHLMLGIVTSSQQHLHAFWTPFLLMHIALPDNISAYSVEDNALSSRALALAPAQVAGAILALCKHFVVVHDAGALRPAAYLMFTLGIAKYIESVWALRQGNLGTIRRSIKKMKPDELSAEEHEGHGFKLNNEQALLLAHDLLYVSKGAFADYSFSLKPVEPDAAIQAVRAFSRSQGWEDMCKVVEMELSLMYDVMYTKAAVGHTWPGYCIRLASPLFTAAALLLFWSDNKDGQSSADVIVTYSLLIVTLVLDVGWLLRSLGSTWTCAFLKHSPYWLLGCSHRLIRSLGFMAVKYHLTSYRMWSSSGTIGQYNLLRESCRRRRGGTTMNISSRLVKMVATEDNWMEYQYGYSKGIALLPFVRDLLFQGIWEILKKTFQPPAQKVYGEVTAQVSVDPDPAGALGESPPPGPPPSAEAAKVEADLHAGQIAHSELGDALDIGPEFQEVVLRWHIATDIFLLCRPSSTTNSGRGSYKYVKAIQELSNYMMFLVAVRPGMLPGLYLLSMHDATREALDKICCGLHAMPDHERTCCTCSPRDEMHFAEILKAMEPIEGSTSLILSEGRLYAKLMLSRVNANEMDPNDKTDIKKPIAQLKKLMPDLWWSEEDGVGDWSLPMQDMLEQHMLEHILGAWVRLLLHASTRCSRGSHAKQLGRGGDLTTVVWMLADHAALFRIPQHN